MEKFNNTYGFYPRYPVADAGYGSYNNYLYCEQKCMEKYKSIFYLSGFESERQTARGGRLRPLPAADKGSNKEWQKHNENKLALCVRSLN